MDAKDAEVAMAELGKAADDGLRDAQFFLGYLLHSGELVRRFPP